MKLDDLAISVMAVNLLAFFSGFQIAVGSSILVTLLSLTNMKLISLALLIVSAMLFLLAGVLSISVVWQSSAMRRKGDLARFTLLEPEDVMKAELVTQVKFVGIRMTRRNRVLILLALDLVFTAGGIVLGIGSRLIWS